MAKRHTRRRRQKRFRRKTMKGGAFTEYEVGQLINICGFTSDQIEALNDFEVSFDNVMQTYNTIMNENNGNNDDIYQQVFDSIRDEMMNDNPQSNNNNNNPQTNIDQMPPPNEEIPDNNEMDIDELNVSQRNSQEGYTTGEDSDNEYPVFGGKRKTRKNKKHTKKSKKSRKHKQKGGRCYGNGIGANSYDPNYSIYNTNELKLFPYKP